MGDSAENLKDDGRLSAPEDEVTTDEADVEVTAEGDGSNADGVVAESTDEEEFEVVLENAGDAPRFTQDQVDGIVQRRLAKAKNKGEMSSKELDLAREENKLLRLALEQKQKAGPPKADDFAEGEFDPAYVKAQKDFESAERESEVARLVDERYQREQEERRQRESAAAMEGAVREHYSRAAKLKVKDYEATEDVAIEALGQSYADQIIANLPDSAALMYYLGKNPGEAAGIASLIKKNPIAGVAEIGRLAASIRVKPKSSKAPEPEESLSGGNAVVRNRGPKGARYE